jgi:hypothetical protein
MLLCFVFLLAAPFGDLALAALQTRTITFEEKLTGPVQTRYAGLGVVFGPGARIVTASNVFPKSKAYSGTKVLLSGDLNAEQNPSPLALQFTFGVKMVYIRTGIPWDSKGKPVEVAIRGYNANGGLVHVQSQKWIGPTGIVHTLGLKAIGTQTIHKVLIDHGWFEAIDDLEFYWESGGAAQLPIQPPTVKLTQPTANVTMTSKITIAGEIRGQGLAPGMLPPRMRVDYILSPAMQKAGSPAFFDTDLTLGVNLQWQQPGGGQAPYLTFHLPYLLEFLGPNTITITATNTAGKSGTGQISIQLLPKAIADEYKKHTDSTGHSPFGAFQWGRDNGGCVTAVYQGGAITSSSAGTFSIWGKIFKKWLQVGTLGCATGVGRYPEGRRWTGVWGQREPALRDIDDALCQDFVGGRIYSSKHGTYYVIEPFVSAIDWQDFDVNFGVPVCDPVQQSVAQLPAMWQRFEPTDSGHYFKGLGYSTMELTTNPNTLWIATPDLLSFIKVGPEWKVPERLPTVWRRYPCGPIGKPSGNIVKLIPTFGQAASRPLTELALLSTICDYTTYPNFVPQWAHIHNQKKIVSTIGTVRSSGLSPIDCPFDHYCSVGLSDTGVDWCPKILPDPGFEDILSEGKDYLEIEYEWCIVGYPEPVDWNDQDKGAKPGQLEKYDKLFVAGRWISDCGHDDPYKSEIHPPAVVVGMYSGKWYSVPATLADMVYFDWWYPGEWVEVSIWPPPRPRADAKPVFMWPKWKSGVVQTVLPMNCPNHVHLKITGRTDIPKEHNPPYEGSSGQLYHGRSTQLSSLLYGMPTDPARKTIIGQYILRWQ